MKRLATIFLVLGFASILLSEMKWEGHTKIEEIKFDTIYLVSWYSYDLVDDNVICKRIIIDTLHSASSTLEEFPVNTVRIFRIDTIRQHDTTEYDCRRDD